MSTFVQMQTNIANYLNRTDLTSEIKLAINRAIRTYSKTRFWFDEAVGTFVTVNGTQSYGSGTIPALIRNIDYVRLTVASTYYQLIERDINYIISANVNNNTSQPTDYAWYAESIYLYPTPGQVYTVTVYYHKTYATMTADADTNSWTENPEAEEVIEKASLSWLYENVVLDPDRAAQYKEAAKFAYRNLVSMNEQLTGMNGAIRATSW